MGELGEKNSEPRTVLEQYRLLKQTALKKFPEVVQDAVIEERGKKFRVQNYWLPQGR